MSTASCSEAPLLRPAAARGRTPALAGLLLALLLLLVALTAGCANHGGTNPGPDSEVATLGPGEYERSIRQGRRQRSYLVLVPPAARTGDPLPVVLAFHGGSGHAQQFRDSNGLADVAMREGFILVHPDGIGPARLHTWNAGGCCGRAALVGVDDVDFVRRLLDDLAEATSMDPARVFATGHSNGGMMAYRLAAEIPERLAGIAPVGGAGSADGVDENSPSGPVPILHIHSVDDPRALYQGGEGPPFPLTGQRVRHRPVGDVLGRWQEENGCSGDPVVEDERNWSDPEGGDPHMARLLAWRDCSSGAPILHWQMTGVGHSWPGAPAASRRARELVGPRTQVIEAAEEVWRFFDEVAPR